MLEDYPGTEVHWVVLGAAGARAAEAKRSAELFLANAGTKQVVTRDFKDGYFPYVGAELKDFIEQVKRGFYSRTSC